MSPEEVESVYYDALRKNRPEAGIEPLDQEKLRMSAWQAVIDAVENSIIKRQAEQYLNFSNH